MTAAVSAAGRRYLPRGWSHFGKQFAIWIGFALAYQLVRGVADRSPAQAFANGLRVIGFEQHTMHRLVELSFQRIADSSHVVETLASWTYWNSEFTVISITLLWVYLRRHEAFARFRNTILLTNLIGLVGYVLMPTAPPRMFAGFGFVDTLAQFSTLNQGSGLVTLAANPYAAMPSLHAADSLIVGLMLASVVRNRVGKALWAVWPLWVWFCVLATGNHFVLDVLVGGLVAIFSLTVVYRRPVRQLVARALAG